MKRQLREQLPISSHLSIYYLSAHRIGCLSMEGELFLLKLLSFVLLAMMIAINFDDGNDGGDDDGDDDDDSDGSGGDDDDDDDCDDADCEIQRTN
ncbi:unnamed protein product [Acanthocheilonema viteae]|uniref:Uncharacterized protein n=1 Tax=Acanthocheilonema viteae TaxID=6277 RepID=A0A498SLQ5_ACAVI|nr:unnamed protein product [Acanthocheilonema viteae]